MDELLALMTGFAMIEDFRGATAVGEAVTVMYSVTCRVTVTAPHCSATEVGTAPPTALLFATCLTSL